MSHYFLAGSLPMLAFDEPPRITTVDFLSACQSHLAETEFKVVVAALEQTHCRHGFVRAWRDRDCQIRNTLAVARAQHRATDPQPYLRTHVGFDVATQHAVQEAMGRPHPLDRERGLDRLRWSTLDELAGPDMFRLDYLVAYGLKLQILERWAAMDDEAGNERVEQVVGAELEQLSFA